MFYIGQLLFLLFAFTRFGILFDDLLFLLVNSEDMLLLFNERCFFLW